MRAAGLGFGFVTAALVACGGVESAGSSISDAADDATNDTNDTNDARDAADAVGAPPAAVCGDAAVAVTEPGSLAAYGENLDTTCALAVGKFPWKSEPPGASCTHPLDCAPVCCVCPRADTHALTSWCDHGTCAAPDAVCCAVLGTTLHACGG